MKVLNLECPHGHGFEGWFGSEADYLDQQARGLLRCPVCDADRIEKRPSAPRLNLSASRPPRDERVIQDARASAVVPREPAGEGASPAHGAADNPEPGPGRSPVDPAVRARLEQLHAAWIEPVKAVVAHTEDVGDRFTEEARRMHYGETEARGIRGTATPEQRAELADEGVEVLSLPMPDAIKGPRH